MFNIGFDVFYVKTRWVITCFGGRFYFSIVWIMSFYILFQWQRIISFGLLIWLVIWYWNVQSNLPKIQHISPRTIQEQSSMSISKTFELRKTEWVRCIIQHLSLTLPNIRSLDWFICLFVRSFLNWYLMPDWAKLISTI